MLQLHASQGSASHRAVSRTSSRAWGVPAVTTTPPEPCCLARPRETGTSGSPPRLLWPQSLSAARSEAAGLWHLGPHR